MAGDLLPALDPLLDPRSPAAQAVLDRTSYSVRGLGNPAGAFFAPGAGPARAFRATPAPVQGSACAAGVLGSSRGEVLPVPYRPVVTRRVARRPQTPPAWHRRLALAGEWRGLRPSCTLRAPT